MTSIPDQYYTTRAITPKPVVWLNGIELQEGVDYELNYVNNIAIGKNTAKVIIIGINNFDGEIEISFSIIKTVLDLIEDSGYIFAYAKSARDIIIENHDYYSTSRRIILGNVSTNTTIEDFLLNFREDQRDYITLYNASGTKVSTSKYKNTFIGTGYRIVLRNTSGQIADTIYVSVVGDTNGDGIVTSVDINNLSRYLRNAYNLNNEYYFAVDLNSDGSVTGADLTILSTML